MYARQFVITQLEIPDYVFEPDYYLMPIEDLETFIVLNKHLPGVPYNAETQDKGLNMGQMETALLEKVEELTLYIIEQKQTN